MRNSNYLDTKKRMTADKVLLQVLEIAVEKRYLDIIECLRQNGITAESEKTLGKESK